MYDVIELWPEEHADADVNASFVISLRHQGIFQSPIDRDVGEGKLTFPKRIVA